MKISLFIDRSHIDKNQKLDFGFKKTAVISGATALIWVEIPIVYSYGSYALTSTKGISDDRQKRIDRSHFKKLLILFFDEYQNARTLEIHVYGNAWGNHDMVIGYQIDAGHGIANELLWKFLPADAVHIVEPHKHFSSSRNIPARYMQRMRTIYAQV